MLRVGASAVGLALALVCGSPGTGPSTDDGPPLIAAEVAGVPGPPGPVAAALAPAGFPGSTPPTRASPADGRIPGRTPLDRAVATRALLDLTVLTDPTGAAVAAPFGPWALVWPRDASWYAAAFAATGHPGAAWSIAGFLARAQRPDGTWDARYHPDGRPVRDGRPRELDAVGWVPWAVWSAWQADPDPAALSRLWPTVRRAADAAAAALQPDGLPRPGADYWERAEDRPTLGVAAPLLLGLRAAADLATARGAADRQRTWTTAAGRLSRALTERFGATGYRRHPEPDSSPDAAAAFLSAPLAVLRPESGVAAALARDEHDLLMPSGGLRPGLDRRIGNAAWTAETALFALADAGDDARFGHWFDWLVDHRTGLGEFPEKVTDAGRPASVAPLGWTAAIVLLALTQRDGRLRTPPAPDLR